VWFLAEPAFPSTSFERAYSDAMNAHAQCISTWSQRKRTSALEVLQDRGAFMATTLNPISKDAQIHMAWLSEVTAALRERESLVSET
jgi:hypothetical protein